MRRSRSSSASVSFVPCRNSIGIGDVREVRRAVVRRLAGRVQREGEEHQAAHAVQRRERLGLRGHAPAERPAAGEQRRRPRAAQRLGGGRPHRGVGDRRRIDPLAALLHVRELIAKRRDAALGSPSAIAAIDLWVMPAPAPCASTRQARRPASRAALPEAPSTRRSRALRSATEIASRVRACHRRDDGPASRDGMLAPRLGSCGPACPPASTAYRAKRRFSETPEPRGGAAAGGRTDLRRPEAPRAAHALRPAPADRRHAEELGGAGGAVPRSQGPPLRQAGRGPSRSNTPPSRAASRTATTAPAR